MSTIGRSNSNFRRRRAIYRGKCAKANAPCALCHGSEGPIDYKASDRSDYGFQLDHIIPWSKLLPGDRLRWSEENWQPSHGICNKRKSSNIPLPPPKVKRVSRPVGWG